MNNLNRSHTNQQNAETQWAAEALKSVVDIACLNAFFVETGLFSTYIYDMESSIELQAFSEFLLQLNRNRKASRLASLE